MTATPHTDSNLSAVFLTICPFTATLSAMNSNFNRAMMGMMMAIPKPQAALGPSSRG